MGFTFVDLFSGIGGFHIAATKLGGKCVQACDISDFAQQTYYLNFGIHPHNDIKTIDPVRAVDLVTFGSPCQPYSMAGMRLGLDDQRGGKLLEHVYKYLDKSSAKSFIMENVKGILTTNNGNDIKIILRNFSKLGYKCNLFILNSKDFGIPQNRERVYIVGHKLHLFNDRLIRKQRLVKCANDLLDSNPPTPYLLKVGEKFKKVALIRDPKPSPHGLLLKAKIGKGYTQDRVLSSNGIIGTVIANWSPVIYDERYKCIRELSQQELLQFQGFPKLFIMTTSSRKKIIKAIGNAVCIPVVKAIIKSMLDQQLLG
jgi:DNA (cytosine-5)-methyltransferase 1